jgi:hypothetical protein
LQSGFQVSAHGRAHVPVDTVHSWHLVAHPLGLQDFGDAVLIHPNLETVAKAVGRYPPEHRQPGRYGHVLSRLLSGT